MCSERGEPSDQTNQRLKKNEVRNAFRIFAYDTNFWLVH